MTFMTVVMDGSKGEGAGGAGGGGGGGAPPPPPPRDDLRFSNATGILQKNKTMWFIGVEVDQETSAPPPKKKSWIRPWLYKVF